MCMAVQLACSWRPTSRTTCRNSEPGMRLIERESNIVCTVHVQVFVGSACALCCTEGLRQPQSVNYNVDVEANHRCVSQMTVYEMALCAS